MKAKFEIRYLKSAEKDLYNIFDYIKKDNPDAANSLIEKIDKQISLLGLNSKLGKVPEDIYLRNKGYRVLIVEKYLIFYVIKEKIIQIRRVLHGYRNYLFIHEPL